MNRGVGAGVCAVLGLIVGIVVSLYLAKWDFNPPAGWYSHLVLGAICAGVGAAFGAIFGAPQLG